MARILLDTNVFIFGYPDDQTNSFLIIENIDGEMLEPVVSDDLIEEVMARGRVLYGKDVASLMRFNILTLPNLTYVSRDEITRVMRDFDDLVADKSDLPHICAYLIGECDYFITSNRRLTRQRIREKVNFFSPFDFVQEVLGLQGYDTPEGI
jgi:predicted nucleic acid-binding protein